MTSSITAGLRAAIRHLKIAWLLWAWYGLLALVPVVPAWTWWNGALGSSPEAVSLLQRFDLGVLLDVVAGKGINGIGLLTGAAAGAGVIAVVSSAFSFGGVLEILGGDDDRRTFMHRFFRGGGHFFWRFFRLAVMAGVCLILATGVVSGLMVAITKPMSESEWEPGWYLGRMASLAAIAFVGAFFLVALDYARIRVARDDSRSMLRAYLAGMGFVLRRMLSVYGIAVAFLVLQLVVVVGYLAYETNAPAAGTWGAIAMLFLVQQVVVFGRVMLRVAFVGAERHLFERALPRQIPAVPMAVTDPTPGSQAEPGGPTPDADLEPGPLST